MIFELMDSDLQAFASQFLQRQLPLRELYALSIQLSTAVSLLQAKGVLHRDIYPKNVLVSTGLPVSYLTWTIHRMVLADFGWGTFSASSDIRSPSFMTGGAYVASYRPPELFMSPGSRFDHTGSWFGPPHIAYGLKPC